VRLLLDTHAFLWLVSDDPRVSRRAREVFSDKKNEVFLSVASVWEMAIKLSLDKLRVQGSLPEVIAQEVRNNAVKVMPVELEHALLVSSLPFHHRDPFDRLLVAQALVEKLVVLSNDDAFDRYSTRRVW
jgi:PIN domain nuclease of toxin-antitoxin system